MFLKASLSSNIIGTAVSAQQTNLKDHTKNIYKRNINFQFTTVNVN